jgi:hypothetical protein
VEDHPEEHEDDRHERRHRDLEAVDAGIHGHPLLDEGGGHLPSDAAYSTQVAQMGSIRTRIFIPSTSLTLISHLQGKIVEKSRLYEDEALQNIFLMNNLLYIVQKVKDSELKTLLGDNWIRKRRGKIRQYSTGYFRSSWTRTLACLIDDGLPQAMGSSSALKNALKGRFKNFNLHSRSCTGHILHGGLWINSVGF